MKRKLFLAVLFAFTATVLFAQAEFGGSVTSLESEKTAELFTNEIDDAFNVSPGFGGLANKLIYAGVANPHKLKGQDTNSTFTFGYYTPEGKLPLSVYFDINGLALSSINRGSKTDKVWSDNQHSRLIKETKTSHTWMPLFIRLNTNTQILLGLGNEKALGIKFAFNSKSDNIGADNFEKIVVKDYLNPNNDYTEIKKNIPAITTPLTLGTIDSAVASGSMTTEFGLGVPFAFAAGNMEHVVEPYIGSEIIRRNASYSKKTSSDNIKFKVTDISATTVFGARYDVEMPAKREDDKWSFGGSFFVNVKTATKRASYEDKDKALKYAYDMKPGAGFQLTGKAARLFNFNSPEKTVLFKIKPTAELSFGLDASNIGKKTIASQTKPLSTSTTTTIKGTGTLERTYGLDISVPTGLRILPANWKVGFLLGATPKASFELKASGRVDKHGKHTTVSGTGTSLAQYDATTHTVGGPRTVHISFSEQHMLGITIPFESGAHLDISVNGENLWKFESLQIQAVIPLASKK
ncbi:hypothetical protein [Treponema pedis]|uniref:hypothetical protein n=1 Tax=Treponema pedis TaxID=409322 RepID=UPI0003FBEC7E|nr:hypothetical protein [Treponema pedis]